MKKGDGTGGAGVLTSRQANLSNLIRAGFRVKPQTIQKANDDALKAAIAESLKPPPMRADAMTNHQAKIFGAMHAGLRVSPQAIQVANDNALAAAIQESLKESSPATSHDFHSPPPLPSRPPQASAMPTPPASPTRPAAPPLPPRPTQASAMPTPPASPRPGTPESTTKPAGQATASSAASGAQAPHPTAHEQLGIPEGADWRQILKMDGRVSPKTVMENAKTRDGIQQMTAEITKAEQDARKQYRKLLIQFHPDKHFGKDMKAVNDVIADAYNQSEKEFASAKKWLDAQSETVTG
jgi:hypothetical protein